MKQYGFQYEPPSPEDFIFGSSNSLGAKFSGDILQPSGDWSAYLPITEFQAPNFETQGCVSFGSTSIIETLKKRLSDTSINLSDRFVVKGSGTDPNGGNSPKKVAEFIRKNWACFEDEWPMEGVSTVDEYYKDIPQNLKTLAIGRGAEYDFGYEIIKPSDIREALKYSPVGMSVAAWLEEDGVYIRPQGATDNHFVMCHAMQPNGDYLIFDSYPPYIKQVRADMNPTMVQGYYLRRQVVQESFWEKFLQWLQLIIGPTQPEPMPLRPPAPEPVTPEPLASDVIFDCAESVLGRDVSPEDRAKDEFGCAESLNDVLKIAGYPLKSDNELSTYSMYKALKESKDWIRTETPVKGDIIITPTGYLSRKNPDGSLVIPHGHCGLLGENERIMSNNSYNGKWMYGYTIFGWHERFVQRGGGLVAYFHHV